MRLFAASGVRGDETLCVTPLFLCRLGIETFHCALPFRLDFRHLSQLGRGTEKTDLDIIAAPGPLVIAPTRMRRLQALQSFRHAQADEMVFEPLTFKPGAGSGEV